MFAGKTRGARANSLGYYGSSWGIFAILVLPPLCDTPKSSGQSGQSVWYGVMTALVLRPSRSVGGIRKVVPSICAIMGS